MGTEESRREERRKQVRRAREREARGGRGGGGGDLVLGVWDRVVRDIRNEAQSALGADHEVGQNVDGVFEIHQRVDRVARGVLQTVLVLDPVFVCVCVCVCVCLKRMGGQAQRVQRCYLIL